MPDPTDMRIEMLQSHVAGKALVQQLSSLIDIIVGTDEETFKAQVQQDPKPVIAAINSLMRMINRLQDSNDQLMEYWLGSMDNVHEIYEMIAKLKE